MAQLLVIGLTMPKSPWWKTVLRFFVIPYVAFLGFLDGLACDGLGLTIKETSGASGLS